MATPQQAAEAAQATVVFQAAMTMLGFKAIAQAISLWAEVSSAPGQVNASSGRWLTYALTSAGAQRQQARALTVAFYRLHRALLTGYTVHDIFNDESPPVSIPLSTLRDEFYDQVESFASEIYEDDPVEIPGSHAETEEAFDEVDRPDDESPDLDVEVEVIDFTLDDAYDLEDSAEEEARIVLEALGPDNLLAKYDEIKDSASDKVDAQRQEAHRKVGYRQAAAAERLVLNGSRDYMQEMARKDHRVIAWARASRTGTPCGFCAMLISRGAAYGSEESATQSEGGDQYHDNCHCYAIPVYSKEHYDRDSTFDLNREYDALWAEFTEDYEGDDVLSGWRKFIRQRNDPAQAQAA